MTNAGDVSLIIPAWREDACIAETIRAAGALTGIAEVIVVDDGSGDGTASAAEAAGATHVLRLPQNRGKGAALEAGIAAARFDLLLLLDADLGASAAEAAALIAPVRAGDADMAIAAFPPPAPGTGGWGIVVRLARAGIRATTGRTMTAPLSGQRCLHRAVYDAARPLAPRFGVEVAMTIEALHAGFTVCEVPTQMRHRVTGRDLPGLRHRGRQLLDVAVTLAPRLLGNAQRKLR